MLYVFVSDAFSYNRYFVMSCSLFMFFCDPAVFYTSRFVLRGVLFEASGSYNRCLAHALATGFAIGKSAAAIYSVFIGL